MTKTGDEPNLMLIRPAAGYSKARDVQRADFPGLRRKPDRGVSGTESLIAAPLHDLEKESFVEDVGIDLEEFAVAFTVVQNPIGPKIGHRPGIQIVAGLDVVIIVVGNFQEAGASRPHLGNA